MALPEPVDIGSLGRIIRALQDHLKESARQGADEQTALDSQFIGIGEEAGEALGAYRRWRGFARRAGTSAEVYDELADVLIVTMVGIIHYAEVQGHVLGSGDGSVIEEVLARKLNKIFSRGWVNKDAETVLHTSVGDTRADSDDISDAQSDWPHAMPVPSKTIQSITTYPTPEGGQPTTHDYGGPVFRGRHGCPDPTPRDPEKPTLHDNGVYLKTDRGFSYLGHKDSVDWAALQPPYTVVLGRNLKRGE